MTLLILFANLYLILLTFTEQNRFYYYTGLYNLYKKNEKNIVTLLLISLVFLLALSISLTSLPSRLSLELISKYMI